MAIRAVLARRSRYDRETIVLETIVLPIKLPAHMAARALLYRLCPLMQSDTLVTTMYPLNRYYLRFSIG